jgi:hypothetical protein
VPNQSPANYDVAGCDGNRFLMAERGDDPMRQARVDDLETGQVSPDQPLQVWFKWAEWDEASYEDYLRAKDEIASGKGEEPA